ncbi:MAG: serine--tRNA ligase, partial [Armatimonadetes bacterium]|nr:serine--tRNA ligase [Armatimonadota bacterium]
MLDIGLIRSNPDLVRDSLRRRGADASMVDQILAADEKRRATLTEMEKLKHEKNVASESIPRLKKEGEDVSGIVAEMRALGDRIKALEGEVAEAESARDELLKIIPNIPHESVPDGDDDSANVHIRSWGQPYEYSFTPLPHWDIAERLDIVDFERAVKIAGSRFVLMKGMGARLERALINFMLDLHTSQHGYTEVLPPYIVNDKSMFGTGQLPRFEEDLFKCRGTELYLIPTSEVPVTNMYRDEILEADQLPIYFSGFSACFRSEAGAAGRDTRGMLRVHQFQKVELVKFTSAETSYEELDKMVQDAEKVLQILEIPYRVMQICLGDLGFTPSKKFDLEYWAPGQNRWVEVSSCSNCTDFQARRANIRYRPAPRAKPEFVHTLNGSGLAVGRTLVAILENFQQPDGSVKIPKALQGYMGGVD